MLCPWALLLVDFHDCERESDVGLDKGHESGRTRSVWSRWTWAWKGVWQRNPASLKTTLQKHRSIRIAQFGTLQTAWRRVSADPSIYPAKTLTHCFPFSTVPLSLTLRCTLFHFSFLLVSQIDLRLKSSGSFSPWLSNSTLPCLNLLLCVVHKANLSAFLSAQNCTQLHTCSTNNWDSACFLRRLLTHSRKHWSWISNGILSLLFLTVPLSFSPSVNQS